MDAMNLKLLTNLMSRNSRILLFLLTAKVLSSERGVFLLIVWNIFYFSFSQAKILQGEVSIISCWIMKYHRDKFQYFVVKMTWFVCSSSVPTCRMTMTTLYGNVIFEFTLANMKMSSSLISLLVGLGKDHHLFEFESVVNTLNLSFNALYKYLCHVLLFSLVWRTNFGSKIVSSKHLIYSKSPRVRICVFFQLG